MKRELPSCGQEAFDLVIVGGGITGACAAWDATLRGLSVALIEKDDFGGATSANSLKIIHGGLRYLQQLDFRRMRESIRERSLLMRIAPHLVRPLPVLVPTYRRFRESRLAFGTALRISDLVGFDRNRMAEGCRTIPRGTLLGRSECLQLFDGFNKQGLSGGALWHDGQVLDSERLTLSFLLSAAQRGAVLANYAEVSEFLVSGSRIEGVLVRDRVGNQDLEVRARVVLNTAGPWVGELLRSLDSRKCDSKRHALVLAINVATPRLFSEVALGLKTVGTRGPVQEAGKRRYLFLTPWMDRTLVGTLYCPFKGRPDEARAREEDLQALVDETNEACPSLDLSLKDLSFHHCGLLPRATSDSSGRPLSLLSRDEIVDHEATDGVEGLISAVAVKYTTARLLAQRCVDRVFVRLGRTPPACETGVQPIWGGEKLADVGQAEEAPSAFSNEVAQRLRQVYGNRWAEIAGGGPDDPRWLGKVVPGAALLRCEILWAVREEMAMTLADVVLRRTNWGAVGCPPRRELVVAAEVMAAELRWEEQRLKTEVKQVVEAYRPLAA